MDKNKYNAEYQRLDALLEHYFQQVYAEQSAKKEWRDSQAQAMWCGGEAARRAYAEDAELYPLNVYQNIMTRKGFGMWADKSEREEVESAISARIAS